MRFLAWSFLVLSVIGLVLSLVTHGMAWLSFDQPLGDAAFILHIGVFIVWIPTVIVASRLTKDTAREERWRVTLRGCPTWMRWTAIGFFVYAIINFTIFFAL